MRGREVAALLGEPRGALAELLEDPHLLGMMADVGEAEEILERRVDQLVIRLAAALELADLPVERREKRRHVAMILAERAEQILRHGILHQRSCRSVVDRRRRA